MLKILLFRDKPEYISCQMIALPLKYDFKPYAYGFQKDSPYLPLFNHYIKGMQERGAILKILENYVSQPQVCPDYTGKPLGFDSCGAAFLVFLIGPVIGIILFIVEFASTFCGGRWTILEMYDKRPIENTPNSPKRIKNTQVIKLKVEYAYLKRDILYLEKVLTEAKKKREIESGPISTTLKVQNFVSHETEIE